MAVSGVYQIRNMVNNHRYIGSSNDIYRRRKDHCAALKMGVHNSHFQHAFDKYGIKNFKFKILLYCDPNMLLYYEQACIDKFKPEYNMCPIAGNTLGCKHTKEDLEKMSISHKWQTPPSREGTHHSDEWKYNMSRRMLGNTYSKGRKPSEETKRKMSESQKRRYAKKNGVLYWIETTEKGALQWIAIT